MAAVTGSRTLERRKHILGQAGLKNRQCIRGPILLVKINSEEPAPTPDLAAAIAARVTGRAPNAVARFTTGARHYVYEATFAGRPPIVVRIGSASAHAEMAGAVHLSNLLRPRGAPLPAILAQDIQSAFPWIALERLPGVDLGAVMGRLTDAQLDRIAANVARAGDHIPNRLGRPLRLRGWS